MNDCGVKWQSEESCLLPSHRCACFSGHEFPHKCVCGEKLSRCFDCEQAAKLAYSDSTTPGFLYDRCERHRL